MPFKYPHTCDIIDPELEDMWNTFDHRLTEVIRNLVTGPIPKTPVEVEEFVSTTKQKLLTPIASNIENIRTTNENIRYAAQTQVRNAERETQLSNRALHRAKQRIEWYVNEVSRFLDPEYVEVQHEIQELVGEPLEGNVSGTIEKIDVVDSVIEGALVLNVIVKTDTQNPLVTKYLKQIDLIPTNLQEKCTQEKQIS